MKRTVPNRMCLFSNEHSMCAYAYSPPFSHSVTHSHPSIVSSLPSPVPISDLSSGQTSGHCWGYGLRGGRRAQALERHWRTPRLAIGTDSAHSRHRLDAGLRAQTNAAQMKKWLFLKLCSTLLNLTKNKSPREEKRKIAQRFGVMCYVWLFVAVI